MQCYNDHLQQLDGIDDSWFTASWLFAECYLYARYPLRMCPQTERLNMGPSLLPRRRQIPRPPDLVRKDRLLGQLRPLFRLQGGNVQVQLCRDDPCVLPPEKRLAYTELTRSVDLAKSLMALDERKDLLHEWESSGSVLEIVFLYVQRCCGRPTGRETNGRNGGLGR